MTDQSLGPTSPPIFIVGCARSGTTLLRLMLDSHPNISCGPETHFLPELVGVVDKWPWARRFGLPREYVLDRIRGFYGGIQADYMRSRGKSRWAEKTPNYCLYMPLISELYPDAKFIHVLRDARDVVASTRDRWGYPKAYGTALFKWRRHVVASRTYGAQLPPDRFFELRYEDLVADPEAAIRGVLEFVGEPWDPVVLRYDEVQHDEEGGHFKHAAKQRGGAAGKLIYSSRVKRGANLDPFLRLATWIGCGRLMRSLDY